MLSYNQVTNSEINNNGVSIKEIAPIMKLNLRGKTREFFTNVGKSLNMILPTEAKKLLRDNINVLHKIVEVLMKEETIEGSYILELLRQNNSKVEPVGG